MFLHLTLVAVHTQRAFAGWLWLSSLVRLVCYSCILWPGFLLMGIFYFFSSRVKRDVWYGRQVRRSDLRLMFRQRDALRIPQRAGSMHSGSWPPCQGA